jgi:hypothetical protein
MQLAKSEEFDLEPAQGEPRQERIWVYDLLGHPSPGIPNLTVDQHSSYSCGTRGCSIGLGPTEKCGMS